MERPSQQKISLLWLLIILLYSACDNGATALVEPPTAPENPEEQPTWNPSTTPISLSLDSTPLQINRKVYVGIGGSHASHRLQQGEYLYQWYLSDQNTGSPPPTSLIHRHRSTQPKAGVRLFPGDEGAYLHVQVSYHHRLDGPARQLSQLASPRKISADSPPDWSSGQVTFDRNRHHTQIPITFKTELISATKYVWRFASVTNDNPTLLALVDGRQPAPLFSRQTQPIDVYGLQTTRPQLTVYFTQPRKYRVLVTVASQTGQSSHYASEEIDISARPNR